jgi:hypothetical protein
MSCCLLPTLFFCNSSANQYVAHNQWAGNSTLNSLAQKMGWQQQIISIVQVVAIGFVFAEV